MYWSGSIPSGLLLGLGDSRTPVPRPRDPVRDTLSPETQRHIGVELRALYATSSDQFPDRLAGLLRQLEDKLEPSTKDEDTRRAQVDHASE